MKNTALLAAIAGLLPAIGVADTLSFDASDFSLTPVFSNVVTFRFTIELSVDVQPGVSYDNPGIGQIDYAVSGTLSGTPSGFPAFSLVRTLDGDEFYAQGSSLRFEVAAGADLSDGLQVAELVGATVVFTFDAREVDTGRYHPPLFELRADGTGRIQNSNNQGGINPASMQEVNVDYGEEYITDLSFAPAGLTLIAPPPDLVHRDGFEAPETP